MRRPIFAAAVIFPITFFCTCVREFFEGITDRGGGRPSMQKTGPGRDMAEPRVGACAGESLLGGKAQ
jgi:hypothetical protein